MLSSNPLKRPWSNFASDPLLSFSFFVLSQSTNPRTRNDKENDFAQNNEIRTPTLK
jgi:hypothetical protein